MFDEIFLIFPAPIDQQEIAAGFVIEYRDQPIVFRPFNSATLVAKTIWSTDVVRHLALSHLRQAHIHGAVVALAVPGN